MVDTLPDAWYAAAASGEVGEAPLARTLLELPVVLYRSTAGAPVALLDRCPHRFAPLSMGRRCGDALACPYHGMRFDAEGRCTQIPGQSRIPAAARVRSFPVLERYGLVFVWMGDPQRADPARLVEVPWYGRPDWGLSRGYALFRARLANILDNLIDPAHTSFVHARTIGNDAGEQVAVGAEQESEDTVVCGRWVADAEPVPIVRRFARPAGRVDRWQFYRVKLPCTSWVDFGAHDAGLPRTPEALERAPYRVLSYAFLTPQDAGSTHYFSFQLRNFAAGDEAVTAELNQLYAQTFDEDRVLLEAIEQRETQGLQPLRIASDSGVARLRRLRAALEQQAAAS